MCVGGGGEHLGGEDEDNIYSGLNDYNATLNVDVSTLWMALFSWDTNFRGFLGGSVPRISVPRKEQFSV